MYYETERIVTLGVVAVAATVAALMSRGDKALGFWLLAVGAAIGAGQ